MTARIVRTVTAAVAAAGTLAFGQDAAQHGPLLFARPHGEVIPDPGRAGRRGRKGPS